MNALGQLPILAEDVAKATEGDENLNQVMKLTQEEWPLSKKKLDPKLHPFFNRKTQLTIHQGWILCGLRVVIPQSLRKQVLEEVHSAHAVVVQMKSLARGHVWWPQIDQDIERRTKECQPCQENQRNPAKAPLHPWEMPQQPWKRLHIDFAGPFEGQMWLIIVDACSKWPEVIAMTSTTAVKTVDILRSVFSRYGIPDQIVTDNGPQFTAEEFKQFCVGNGINHTLTAPYHPSTNGEAERFVQTFKTSMQKHNGALQKNLCQFLLHYRSHTTTGKTPAEIIFGRNIKTRMDLLHPQSKERKQEKPKSEASFGKNARKLEVEDAVWM